MFYHYDSAGTFNDIEVSFSEARDIDRSSTKYGFNLRPLYAKVKGTYEIKSVTLTNFLGTYYYLKTHDNPNSAIGTWKCTNVCFDGYTKITDKSHTKFTDTNDVFTVTYPDINVRCHAQAPKTTTVNPGADGALNLAENEALGGDTLELAKGSYIINDGETLTD